jgi:hypothetical protein
MHPGSYGEHWENPHSRPPAIAIYMKKSRWNIWVRGATSRYPTHYTSNISNPRFAKFVPGRQEIDMTFQVDPMGENSYINVAINGNEVIESHDVIGMNASGLGATPALTTQIGYYGISPKNLEDPIRDRGQVNIESIELSVVAP